MDSLLILGVTFLLLFAHSFLTYPVSLWLVRAVRGAKPVRLGPEISNPSMVLCFCAHNEETVIQNKIDNLIELRRRLPSLEIVVYLDACTDRTAEILAGYQGLVTVLESSQWHGKTFGMNALVKASSSDIVVFTDANVLLDAEGLAELPRYFADPAVGCVCGQLRYVDANSQTAAVGCSYWRLEESIKQLESDTGSIIGADGSIFAIRRHLHMPVPVHLIDDFYVSLRILAAGYRVVRAPGVMAFEASASAAGDEFQRKARIACQAVNVHRALWSSIRKFDAWTLYKYCSHKLTRWLAGVFVVLGMVFLIAWTVRELGPTSALLVLSLALLGLSIARKVKAGRVRQLGSIVVAFSGMTLGVFQSFAGRTYQTWCPAVSVRETRG